MQEIKDSLKNIGKHFQKTQDNHQELLRQKLSARVDAYRVLVRSFSWSSFAAWSVGGCAMLFLAFQVHYRYQEYALYTEGVVYDAEPAVFEEYALAPSYEIDAYALSEADVAADVIMRTSPSSNVSKNTGAIIDYEEEHGSMIEEQVNIALLTREDQAASTIAELFTSLGGHLSSLQQSDTYASLSGSIPLSRLSFFYDQLDALVKNDAFIEKNIRGQSITSQVLDVSARMDVLVAAQAEIAAQLQVATTDEQKTSLRERLDALSQDMDTLVKEQQTLEDRVAYVEVSLSVAQLPSLWEAHNDVDLRYIVAGYDEPNIWQRIQLHIFSVLFVGVEVMSTAFWILIPLLVLVWRYMKRRKMFRDLA